MFYVNVHVYTKYKAHRDLECLDHICDQPRILSTTRSADPTARRNETMHSQRSQDIDNDVQSVIFSRANAHFASRIPQQDDVSHSDVFEPRCSRGAKSAFGNAACLVVKPRNASCNCSLFKARTCLLMTPVIIHFSKRVVLSTVSATAFTRRCSRSMVKQSTTCLNRPYKSPK